MVKKNKDIFTFSKLLPYVLTLTVWTILCIYFVNAKIIDDSMIYLVMILPASLTTAIPLWLYTKSRSDSIGNIIFNWISILVLSNFAVFCTVYVFTFGITF